MFKVDSDKLIRDASDNQLVAVQVDSSVTAMGVGSQKDAIILRLHHKNWKTPGDLLSRDQAHQFLMTPRCAEILGQSLLELAAQAEKECQPQEARKQ